ncbi:Fic family protein [Treponema primitia]|uniref:Fic family protein n=1 Tax=Treponema primitia TaxID=88058 RepID=UPI00025552AA|nr:Fic family protein [Treponema primitia]
MANNEQKTIQIRRQAIFDFVKVKTSASREEIQDYIAAKFPQSSKITILRDLDYLAANKGIAKQGKTKSAVYAYAASPLLEAINVEEYFTKDPDARVLINTHFNFGVWDNLYDILSETEKAELAAKNKQYLTKRAELSPTALKKEIERITIELAWKSSKIEGNTYTLIDTEELIKGGIEAKDKTHDEAVMILNHKKAIEFIFTESSYFKELSMAKIEYLHRLLLTDLGVLLGVRQRRIAITGTNYSPLDNPFQIKEALEQLISVINAAENPIEKAIITVLMISYIQPFEDGNKRTSRILGNALLLANDYCPLSYRSVNEGEYKKGILLFYEQNNASYFKRIFIDQFNLAVDKYF